MSTTETKEIDNTDSALAGKIRDFMTRFHGKDGKLTYSGYVDAMVPKKAKHIIIDYNDLVYEPEILSVLEDDPDRALDAFSRAIREVLQMRYPDYAERIRDEIRARIINYPLQRSIRQITAETRGRITSVSGMIVRASEIKPLAKEIVYSCPDGHRTKIIQLNKLEAKAPIVCDRADCKHRDFELEPDESKFIDFQIIRLQELPEDLPPGQLPHYIDVTIRQDLVDNGRPGDRIVLTGIVRVEQESVSGIPRGQSGLYRLRIEGNNIEFLGGRAGKTSRKIEREEVTPAEEKQILALGGTDDVYQRLIDSFAPHIRGHDLIKESILLLVVGANQKVLNDGSKIRGDINVFLVGDPGTAKSEMLKFCARIAPRGLYTSGRGSTAAGLTAAVVKDKTGIMMLEAGAVVLGDQGIVSIDEFDKMKPEDRSALHEVMEQQSASIAKGGIVATLNARTSILAAANPMYGKYDNFKNLNENINIPIPLLTRFDLIFIIRDVPSREKDEQIARHIIAQHGPQRLDHRSTVDADLLTKYLAYAKRGAPELTEEAEEKILDYYIKMRITSDGDDEDEAKITVTPRQLEGLVRLATARARLLLKEKVEEEDADRAIYLVQQMLETTGTDPTTGKVDVGILHGKPRSEMSKMQLFMDVLKGLEGDHQSKVPEKDLVSELLKTEKFDEEEAKRYIQKLSKEGSIYESRPGHYNRVP